VAITLAGTGHRPQDCEDEAIVRLKIRVGLERSGANCVVSGMASGYDLWLADEARLLGLEVWSARPWSTHKPNKGDEELYARILAYASRVVVIIESDKFPGNYAYFQRNHWMVDNADRVMAYWNGKQSGGTYECVEYARGKKPIRNIYHDAPF
jgi:hypothetical protein